MNLKLAYAQERKKENVPKIADEIVNMIDQQALAVYYGTLTKNKGVKEQQEEEDAELAKKSKEMQRQKDSLAAALHAKANHALSNGQDAKLIIAQLRSWVDTSEEKYAFTDVKYDSQDQRIGSVFKKITKMLTDLPNSKEIFDIKTEKLEQLSWHHWVIYQQNLRAKKFPPAFVLF
jgi:hypothetical protein